MSSPTQRTLAYLRERGHPRCQVVEKWLPQVRRRVDLYGFVDIHCILLRNGRRIFTGIQATSTGNLSARVKKANNECGPALAEWLDAGGEVYFFGWAKRGGKGKRKLWTVKILNHRGAAVDEGVFGKSTT